MIFNPEDEEVPEEGMPALHPLDRAPTATGRAPPPSRSWRGPVSDNALPPRPIFNPEEEMEEEEVVRPAPRARAAKPAKAGGRK